MVCEPFFEQMLTALQQALQQQQQQKQGCADQVCSTQGQARHTSYHFPQAKQLDPMPDDDESTDAEDCGAFASLLSGPSSEDENSSVTLAKPSDSQAMIPEAQDPECAALSHTTQDESDQASEPEKSTMVCRHWKSKGWCRLGSNCKFQHPDHKRGVAVSKGGSSGTATCGRISGIELPSIRTTLSLTDMLSKDGQVPLPAAAGHKKKGSKDRSMRLLQQQEVVSFC
jgi:hypothetical protein